MTQWETIHTTVTKLVNGLVKSIISKSVNLVRLIRLVLDPYGTTHKFSGIGHHTKSPRTEINNTNSHFSTNQIIAFAFTTALFARFVDQKN